MRYTLTVIFIFSHFISKNLLANVVGSDIQNFNATTSGLDFVTVHSSETLEPGIFNFGFFANYAVNTMPNYENVSNNSRTKFTDSMFGGDINFGLGLFKNWDAGISFPQIYSQKNKDRNDVDHGEISETGITEVRINTKYRFFGDENHGLATVLSANFNRVVNNPFTGSSPRPTYNVELVADTTIKQYAVAGNIGYRFRNPGEPIPDVPIEPYKDQMIASAAVSYWWDSVDTKLIGEVFGSFPVRSQEATTDRDLSTLELLLGIKKNIRRDIALHAGAGTELYHGSSSPDWRIYTGINWSLGPLWSSKDEDGETPSLRAGSEAFAKRPIPASERFVAEDILFEHNSSEITPEFKAVLKDLAEYLRQPPGFKELVVEGHTDSVGSATYNLDLSQRRAQSVVDYLVSGEGLSQEKIKAVGYGQTKPIADNSNYQGRAKNRRVEFNITR